MEPSIEFTKLPPAGEGTPDILNPIEGRVKDALPGERIVLYARSGLWWVQPTQENPYTVAAADSNWRNRTHPGSGYAALLVSASYRPPTTLDALPEKGGNILAVAKAEGAMLTHPPAKTVDFSGYQWTLRESASNRGGTKNQYDPANAWTDDRGFLHLRIAKREKNGHGSEWTSADATLTRSMGYGTYRLVVQDVSGLEPAAVFSMFTWDDAGPPREMNIEISRWGESAGKNGQYVIQPYYVPANVIRFATPAGVHTHLLQWEPGRVLFKTIRGQEGQSVADHVFTSGVPSPGSESIHLSLYTFDNKSNPLQNGAEVVIEKFEYLP